MADELVPSNIQPWDRQPHESSKAFVAFQTYRDLGGTRSLRKVASELGRDTSAVEELSVRHQWVDRALSYDIEMDRRQRARDEEERRSMLDRHRAASGAMVTMALQRLIGDREPQEGQPVEPLDPNSLDPEDIARFLRVGVQAERMAHGMPTDVTRGSYMLDPRDVEKALQAVVDIGLRFCPPEDEEAYMREVKAVGSQL